MVAGAGQQHRAGRRAIPFGRDLHGQRGLLTKPRRHPGGKLLVDVLNDDDRRRKIAWQAAQHGGQCRRPAGGRADGDQPIAGDRAAARAGARRCGEARACDRASVRRSRSSPAAARRSVADRRTRVAGVSTASSAPCPIASNDTSSNSRRHSP